MTGNIETWKAGDWSLVIYKRRWRVVIPPQAGFPVLVVWIPMASKAEN